MLKIANTESAAYFHPHRKATGRHAPISMPFPIQRSIMANLQNLTSTKEMTSTMQVIQHHLPTEQYPILGIIEKELEIELGLDQNSHIIEGGNLNDYPGLTPSRIVQCIRNAQEMTIEDCMTRTERMGRSIKLRKTIETMIRYTRANVQWIYIFSSVTRQRHKGRRNSRTLSAAPPTRKTLRIPKRTAFLTT